MKNTSASTPSPPYYAVIFTSLRSPWLEGYEETANHMLELASKQLGYLGAESFRNAEGFGVTISYWQDLESIRQWKLQEEHLAAQRLGKEKWYKHYKLRICRVERDYEFNAL